jgi:hypothetical protein
MLEGQGGRRDERGTERFPSLLLIITFVGTTVQYSTYWYPYIAGKRCQSHDKLSNAGKIVQAVTHATCDCAGMLPCGLAGKVCYSTWNM